MKTIPRAIATALTALIAVACGAGSDNPSGGFGRALEHLPDTPDVRGGIWVADIALQRELFQIALPGENASDNKVWNYASSIPINLIGNYRHSFIYPALLHAIAIIDCEFGSGANPDNKYIFQTDRLASYLAGYNGAQYAIGMSDSWWPFLGILDHAGASIMKGVKES